MYCSVDTVDAFRRRWRFADYFDGFSSHPRRQLKINLQILCHLKLNGAMQDAFEIPRFNDKRIGFGIEIRYHVLTRIVAALCASRLYQYYRW